MKTKHKHKIEKIELIKVEKPVNRDIPFKYFYNIFLEGIDDSLVIETHLQITNSAEFVGRSIKVEYDTNTNEVSKFDFL